MSFFGEGESGLDFEQQRQVILNVLGYPPALTKACLDHFEYLLKLKDGQYIFFNDAVPINKEWVHIKVNDVCDVDWTLTDIPKNRIVFGFERGIDVRVSEIAWVADAPGRSQS